MKRHAIQDAAPSINHAATIKDRASNDSPIKRLTKSAARVYAVLDNFGEGSTDVIERLIPFFEPILAVRSGQRLNTTDFAAEIRSAYKWNFNEDIVEVFVPRLVERGLLIPENAEAANTSYIISQKGVSQTGEVEGSSEGVLKQFEEIAADFKSFAEGLSPLTALPRSVEEFQDILIEWLLYVEAFSEHNLKFKASFQTDSQGKLRHFVEIPDTTNLKDEEKFLCARYVQHALKTNPQIAEVLSRIASIGLLTEVVQDFVKPVSQVEKSDLVVYLDAPIAMELLGVSGKAARDNIAPIVDELKKIGCQVRIYSQSLQEIKTSLSAVLDNPRPTGSTAQALARGDVVRPFVAAVASDPESFLDAAGIQTTHRTLDQFPSEIAHFTADQYEDMYAAITFQQNANAREHDATVTTFIMRQRIGHASRDLFKAGFILLTKNGLLAQLTKRKCVEFGVMNPSSIPPVIHRRVLATSIWLRTGLGAGNLEIPKRLLLASCEQVLAIRPGVVNAVRQLTQHLGDEEKVRQLDMLVSRDRSAQMLMDKTLGAASVVNEDNISTLFNEMLHPYLEEERRQHEEQLKAEQQKAKEQRVRERKRFESESAAREAAEQELQNQRSEDREAIDSLCQDVTASLRGRRMRKQSIAGVAAALSAGLGFLPMFGFVSIPWPIQACSFAVAVVLAYLTLTGNRLLHLDANETQANQELAKQAKRRALTGKLSRYAVGWDGKQFVLSDAGEKRDNARLL